MLDCQCLIYSKIIESQSQRLYHQIMNSLLLFINKMEIQSINIKFVKRWRRECYIHPKHMKDWYFFCSLNTIYERSDCRRLIQPIMKNKHYHIWIHWFCPWYHSILKALSREDNHNRSFWERMYYIPFYTHQCIFCQ